MDSTAVNLNITIDDWASILNYTNPSDWQTPDPQSPAIASTLSTTPWLDGTWHKTSVTNASVILNFEGPALYIFGASGPLYGSYAVSIDGVESTYSAYSSANASNPYLLWGSGNLTYDKHTLEIRNLGAAQASDQGASGFLLDYILSTVQLGSAGATVTNNTVEDNDSRVTYTGSWISESNALFSGGTAIYTAQNGGSASIKFNGSAVYIFGDSVNDQGSYSVTLDNVTQTYHTLSGCGGGYGKFCEKTPPSLKYFASNLGSSEHIITLTNNANSNGSSFNLDRFVYTTPSQYAPVALANASNPFVNPASSGSSTSLTKSGPASATATASTSWASKPHGVFDQPLLLLLLGIFWVLRSHLCRS
ncbi:hypothetical protein FRB95_006765 [Tulasnella sp. JGI-2019a]|nr:hypothetical protein FRB93_006804 [Tulasnella sp. JGI-2019a]KAG9028187.1 hypothetical protein FRB95_006765 [Tulasnella sp. JGI-2019a]